MVGSAARRRPLWLAALLAAALAVACARSGWAAPAPVAGAVRAAEVRIRAWTAPKPARPWWETGRAVWVTTAPVVSNLADPAHYLRAVLAFPVRRSAFARLGAAVPAQGPGTQGAGDPALDAQIAMVLTDAARHLSWAAASAPDGARRFAAMARARLEAVFGPGAVGPVEVETFLVQ
ncbi:MAG: hypothetical protein K6U87_06050 [Firmicutes bacterium]|nr:hypothetical protein [Bacillota bacterium]